MLIDALRVLPTLSPPVAKGSIAVPRLPDEAVTRKCAACWEPGMRVNRLSACLWAVFLGPELRLGAGVKIEAERNRCTEPGSGPYHWPLPTA